MYEPEVVGLGQEKTRSEEAERGSSKRDGRGLVRGWGTGGAGLGAQLDCGLMNGAAGCLLSILPTLFPPPSRLPLGTKKVRGGLGRSQHKPGVCLAPFPPTSATMARAVSDAPCLVEYMPMAV